MANKELVLQESEITQATLTVVEQANAIIIKDQASCDIAQDFLKNIKSQIKMIETFFADIKGNAYSAWISICAKQAEFCKPLTAAETNIKKQLSDFLIQQRNRQRELEIKERQAREALAMKQLVQAEKLKAKGNIEEAELKEAIAEQIMDLVPAPVQQIQNSKGVSTLEDFDVVITNPNNVPSYINGICIRDINTGAIKKYLKMCGDNKPDIDGIKIVPKMQIRASTNKGE